MAKCNEQGRDCVAVGYPFECRDGDVYGPCDAYHCDTPCWLIAKCGCDCHD